MAALFSSLLVGSSLAGLAAAQSPGTPSTDYHPKLPTYQCSVAGGCTTRQTSVVIDAFSRYTHEVGNTTVMDGFTASDYAAHGISTSGDALTLHMWVKESDGTYNTASPRVYLLDEGEKNYVNFSMLNREIAFDVDLSTLSCGMNGALYFAEMAIDGGRSAINPAGATFGTGYCDAQCPHEAFINGVPNPNGTWGACCNEMDLWEANAEANALTPHACVEPYVYNCTGSVPCGQSNASICDEWGASFNPYKNGALTFYGPGANNTVDTTKKFSVVTQFLTNAAGVLTEIRRVYVQGGKVIQNAAITANGNTYDSITEKYIADTYATWFDEHGGLATMGDALARGMVLIFSIWNDQGGFMNWLDEGTSGPCNATEGDPTIIKANDPDLYVTFSNIRYGELNSTYSGSKCKSGSRR